MGRCMDQGRVRFVYVDRHGNEDDHDEFRFRRTDKIRLIFHHEVEISKKVDKEQGLGR